MQTPGDGIYLPKVFYTVNDKEYKVVGPRYRWYITKSFSAPTTENNSWFYETEHNSLVVNWKTNAFIGIKKNPMSILYPQGSEIDVFYDPRNPKLACVLRYCNNKWIFWLMFLSGVSILLMNFAFLLFL